MSCHFQFLNVKNKDVITVPDPKSWELNLTFPFPITKVGHSLFTIPNVKKSFPLMPVVMLLIHVDIPNICLYLLMLMLMHVIYEC